MGKCILCGCETTDFRCHVRKEGDKYFDNYQCEECTMKKIEKEREEYIRNFNERVLPYLLENNFKVVVSEDVDGHEVIEEFPIKDTDVMYCVDIIRDRMKQKGYYENWIDIHLEEYDGIDFEVVDYLCYALPNKGSELWESFHLKLVGDNGLKLKARYN